MRFDPKQPWDEWYNIGCQMTSSLIYNLNMPNCLTSSSWASSILPRLWPPVDVPTLRFTIQERHNVGLSDCRARVVQQLFSWRDSTDCYHALRVTWLIYDRRLFHPPSIYKLECLMKEKWGDFGKWLAVDLSVQYQEKDGRAVLMILEGNFSLALCGGGSEAPLEQLKISIDAITMQTEILSTFFSEAAWLWTGYVPTNSKLFATLDSAPFSGICDQKTFKAAAWICGKQIRDTPSLVLGI
ncbi:hypothetical protein BS47DRAFT_1389322 [Hydnum rufescens UP504]|uniref:Uncharacterized protein n=1 Tax=Hydnum rufescens UP504 TaxID=1448309 RepID=A0A9P6B5L0_9AGAM|nr:hypothetical protein BS47DRAFT_1389322 [Hydnum rufescens UP504]